MTKWLTSFGTEYTSTVHSINLKRGTAKFEEPHPCGRCGGAGGAEQWRMTGWTCFECGGSGHRGRTRTRSLYTAEAYAKLEATRAKREATRLAKYTAAEAIRDAERVTVRAAILAEFTLQYPGFAERLATNSTKNTFLADINDKLQLNGYLSVNQVAAADRVIAQIALAAASTWFGTVGERVTLTLTVDRVIIPETTGFGFNPIPLSYTYLLHDAQGHKFKYRGRSNAMPCTGETATLVVGIKEHAEYNGTKQTVLDRPKLVAGPVEQVTELAYAR